MLKTIGSRQAKTQKKIFFFPLAEFRCAAAVNSYGTPGRCITQTEHAQNCYCSAFAPNNAAATIFTNDPLTSKHGPLGEHFMLLSHACLQKDSVIILRAQQLLCTALNPLCGPDGKPIRLCRKSCTDFVELLNSRYGISLLRVSFVNSQSWGWGMVSCTRAAKASIRRATISHCSTVTTQRCLTTTMRAAPLCACRATRSFVDARSAAPTPRSTSRVRSTKLAAPCATASSTMRRRRRPNARTRPWRKRRAARRSRAAPCRHRSRAPLCARVATRLPWRRTSTAKASSSTFVSRRQTIRSLVT